MILPLGTGPSTHRLRTDRVTLRPLDSRRASAAPSREAGGKLKAGRVDARLWSKDELIIRERADRAHRDAVYLVEIITSRHELFLVHVSASLVFTVDTPFTWLLQLLDGLFLQHAIHDRSELAGRQQVFLF